MTTIIQSSILKYSSTNSTEMSMKESSVHTQYQKDPSKYNPKPAWKPPLYSKDTREFGKDLTNGDQPKYMFKKEEDKVFDFIILVNEPSNSKIFK